MSARFYALNTLGYTRHFPKETRAQPRLHSMDQTEDLPLLDRSMILLMPTKHMGNLLVALHSIETLATTNRGPTWVVVDESYRDIIESVPAIENPIYYPRARLHKAGPLAKFKLLRGFYRQLRATGAEHLLNFDALQVSSAIATMSGVTERWALGDTPRPSTYQQIIDRQPRDPHRFYHYHQYVQALLGQGSSPAYPALKPHSKHQLSTREALTEQGVDPDKPYVCMHAGATKAYKQWPPECFASIADWLDEQGIQVVFIGAGASDKTIIEQVRGTSRSQPASLCNRLNLGELITLFKQCRLFLGNDSGPMHLATASQTQVVALFGPTDYQRWGPLGANATLIHNPIPCTNSCSKKTCPENFRCIKTLPVDLVRDTLTQYLHDSGSSSASAQARSAGVI